MQTRRGETLGALAFAPSHAHARVTPGAACSMTGSGARCSRRTALTHLPSLAVGAVLLAHPSAAHGGPSEDARAALEELTSRTTGLGPGDVYYPEFFRGEWEVLRELYSVETREPGAGKPPARDDPLLGADAVKALRARVGERDEFKVRFVRHRGKIVADRAYNARTEAAVDRPGLSVSAMWTADNPNVVSIAAAGAKTSVTREVRVTKRAFVDAPQGYGSFVASEYQRVVDVEDDGALMGFGKPPTICAVRRLTKYRVSSVKSGENGELIPDCMDRLTVDYRYAVSKPDTEPVVTLKYREFMARL